MNNTDKQDLTQYSDQELSLLVFNTESLYLYRRDFRLLKALLDESFYYTMDQLEVLEQDILEDLK